MQYTPEAMTISSGPVADSSFDPPVRGFAHVPAAPRGIGLVLTHGAGGDSRAPLLIALAETLASMGLTVLRCDLPYRQGRPTGPPRARADTRDRAGLANAVTLLASLIGGPVCLGGQSYGGRQGTILAAEQPALVHALLLLSYPLHPPRRTGDVRTAHFPRLTTPAMFVHGTRDPFGSVDELTDALRLIPAPTTLMTIDGAGHDLLARARAAADDRVNAIAHRFSEFVRAGSP